MRSNNVRQQCLFGVFTPHSWVDCLISQLSLLENFVAILDDMLPLCFILTL